MEEEADHAVAAIRAALAPFSLKARNRALAKVLIQDRQHVAGVTTTAARSTEARRQRSRRHIHEPEPEPSGFPRLTQSEP